ncbi:hypothetical protein [Campylobacter troglodytis]|uniref:hypothetical protein n=1 Tax=Campylobacter troglodytis TaxID=654363 RepID=UPI00115C3310|nr:hypothetical protein [Campylobacter troglodytis]TQR53161.1 hypothetical protein DMC01_11865 [Campylobacter troglodytis]
MKKILALAFFALSLHADSWLQGSVSAVDEAKKTIMVDTIHSGAVEVKIMPTTKVELDNCGWFGLADSWIFTDNGNFWDLKEGRFVEVDAYYPTNINENTPTTAQTTTATKIEVKCRPRAY